ncbi:energy-coupling factor transporter ATP-binding protein EcfA2 [Paenibacillus sp. DS2015]|uniref:MrcB family domain-containing protein n=1 Tax=Paenibacillus sp. DS2015 TaxID=3373917 RepID=UPI003D1F6881
MTLPIELSNIFTNKEKSYKMVFIVSILNEMSEYQGVREISLENIKVKFLASFKAREAKGLKVDKPPAAIASEWNQIEVNQIQSIIITPIKALLNILEYNKEQQSIGFNSNIYNQLNDEVIHELYSYAEQELENYYNQTDSSFSLHDALHSVMSSYLGAKQESFGGHPLGNLLRQTIPNGLKELSFIGENLKVQGSVGQGNWANIPWIAIMDKRITGTTQHGEYIVYLFAEDMSSVYLTLAQGVTVPKNEMGKVQGYQYLRNKVAEIRNLISLDGMVQDDQIYLTSGGLGQDYQVSTVAYYRYEADQLPDDEQLVADLNKVVEYYNQYVDITLHLAKVIKPEEVEAVDPMTTRERLDTIKQFINRKGFHYPDYLIENFYLSLKTKPFVILAGVSGTGKTKLVKLFAEALGATNENGQFNLIPVRPDWSDPSDLLGYKDLSGTFRPGQLAEVLVDAVKPINRDKPYFICLDEMNLARVEHYFSDLLSILETQKWREDRIVTSTLIHAKSLSSEDDQMRYGNMYLPDNVYIIGTVNMDETTHPFSKKVLDRANTLEFNHITLGQYPDMELVSKSTDSVLSTPNSFLRSDYLQLIDVFKENTELVKRNTELLVKINGILENIHSHVGFRIRDAVCFYMIYNERSDLLSEDIAFDMQLLQKILPRIQGSSISVKRALLCLMEIALGTSLKISELTDDASSLYKPTSLEGARYPQTARKLVFMIRRLEEDGFTSFWLS